MTKGPQKTPTGAQETPETTEEEPPGTHEIPEPAPEEPAGTHETPEPAPEEPPGTHETPEPAPEEPTGTHEKPEAAQEAPKGSQGVPAGAQGTSGVQVAAGVGTASGPPSPSTGQALVYLVPAGAGSGQQLAAGPQLGRLKLMTGQLQQLLGGQQQAAGQLQRLQQVRLDQKTAGGEAEADATVGEVVSPGGKVSERVGVVHSERKTAGTELETVSAVDQTVPNGDEVNTGDTGDTGDVGDTGDTGDAGDAEDGEETNGVRPAEQTVTGPGDQLVSVKQSGPVKVQYYVGPAPDRTVAAGGAGGGGGGGRYQPAAGSAAVGIGGPGSGGGGGAPPSAGAVVQLPGPPRMAAAAVTGQAVPAATGTQQRVLPAVLLMRSGRRRRRRQRRHALSPGRRSTDLDRIYGGVEPQSRNSRPPEFRSLNLSSSTEPKELAVGKLVPDSFSIPQDSETLNPENLVDPLDPPLPPGLPSPEPPFPPERSAEAARWRRMAAAEQDLSFGQYLVLALTGLVSAGLVMLTAMVIKVTLLDSWHPREWSHCCALLLEL